MKNENIDPCPKCGEDCDPVDLNSIHNGLGHAGYVVCCLKCKFSSGYHPTNENAISTWNFIGQICNSIK